MDVLSHYFKCFKEFHDASGFRHLVPFEASPVSLVLRRTLGGHDDKALSRRDNIASPSPAPMADDIESSAA